MQFRSTPSNREKLKTQREMILARLRVSEPILMRELEAIENALHEMPELRPSRGVYSAIKSASDAIVAHLGFVQSPLFRDELAQEIVDGGWLTGNPYALRNVKGAIQYHLDHEQDTKLLKKFPSGRVGLFEWPLAYDQR